MSKEVTFDVKGLRDVPFVIVCSQEQGEKILNFALSLMDFNINKEEKDNEKNNTISM